MHFVAGAAHEREAVAELLAVEVQRAVRGDARFAIASLRPGVGGDAGRNQAQQREEEARADADVAGGMEELLDTGHELIAIGGLRDVDCESGRGALEIGQFGQREREPARRARHFGSELVGDLLALDADAVRQPPHDRVVEQHGLDRVLQQVDEVVVAADVGELVGE